MYNMRFLSQAQRVLSHLIRSYTVEKWKKIMTSRPRLDNTLYQTSPRPKLVDAYKKTKREPKVMKNRKKNLRMQQQAA